LAGDEAEDDEGGVSGGDTPVNGRHRKLKIAALVFTAFVVVVFIAAFLTVRSYWFHNFVREKIISATEDATGGKVELASFEFDWHRLRARISGFVIHGTEPPGSAPLFQTRALELRLKLLSGLKKAVDLEYLGVDRPSANIIVFPNGQTNIPTPRVAKKPSKKSALETVADLAVNRFEILNASVQFAQQKTGFTARGQNLRAQLSYNPVTPSYKGEIRMNPLSLRSGNREPLNLDVSLPLTIERDRVQLANARIKSPRSEIDIDGSLERLAAPLASAHFHARLALEEVRRAAQLPIYPNLRGAPSAAEADVVVNMDGQRIQISTARLRLGRTNFEASGPLRSLQFNLELALDELGKLLKMEAQPAGSIQIGGNAKLTGESDYLVTGNVTTRNISVRQGTRRLNNINLVSAFRVDPNAAEVSRLRISAFGGEITGHAVLEQFARLQFEGRLRNFGIRQLTAALASRPAGYDGTISGTLQARADLKAPGTSGIQAQARLAITPGRRGTPVSGRLQADYDGAADTIVVGKSYVALPHSRLDITGTLGNRLDLVFQSTNLNDFLPAAALPVALKGGSATIKAAVTGKLDSPQVAVHLAVNRFAVDQKLFDQLAADLHASHSGAGIQNGILTRNSLRARFDAAVGLSRWSAGPRQPLRFNADIQNGDLADIAALTGQKDLDLTGNLNATARIGGTIGDPRGGAQLSVVNGSAYQERFERLSVQVNLSDRQVQLSPVQLTAGTARMDLSASFTHPRDSFATGRVQLQVATNQIALERFKTLQQRRPGLAGSIQLNASAAADLRQEKGKSELMISAINANLSARDFRDGKQRLGDLTAKAETAGTNVNFRLNSDFAGSNIQVAGQTGLVRDYPTTADASIRDLPVERVLQLASPGTVPLRGGIFGAQAHVAGTLNDPGANLSFTLDRAVVYDERVDRLGGTVNYTSRLIEIPSLRVSAPAGQIDVNGSLSHPPNDFENGRLNLHLASNDVQLARVENIRRSKPGLSGRLHLLADLSADLKKQQFLISKLDADIGTRGLELNKQSLGNTTLRAQTKGGRLSARLDSDFAGSSIHGSGETQLQGDYPLNAKLTFANVTYAGVQRVMGPAAGVRPDVDGLVEGQVSIQGQAMKPEELRGVLQLSRLEVAASPRGKTEAASKRIALQNQGPIVVEMDRSIVRVKNFRISGNGSDVSLGGTVSLREKAPLNLTVNANTSLAVLQDLDRNIYSAGNVILQAVVRGTFEQPLANGKLELKNASLNLADSPNGISNANGVIVLSGNSASVRNLSGESGGGKVALAGFVGFAGTTLDYRLRAKASNVRARYEGASVVANADLSLTGTSRRSLLGGLVTIQRVAYGPQSDIGSTLSRSAVPPSTPSAPSGPIAGMKLDMRIRTAPDVRFQSTLAEQLHADADLNLRGTLENPGMVGRINITQGQLVFFGNQYSVNRGVISFYDPLRIQPILDISLGTTAKGVDVVLGVTGPVDDMKLTYRSDPPLRFEEIVALLSTGKVPTSDATIAAHQPAPPRQSLTQMGASAVVSEAVAAPMASRLQRVFGVNQLKIDPTFTSGSALPQARVTLQQQISGSITFTYTTDLTRANSQLLRVEWAMTPRFSAVATRDPNGIFGVDFFYNKQFR
jgi:translocation and assembly module TamB